MFSINVPTRVCLVFSLSSLSSVDMDRFKATIVNNSARHVFEKSRDREREPVPERLREQERVRDRDSPRASVSLKSSHDNIHLQQVFKDGSICC